MYTTFSLCMHSFIDNFVDPHILAPSTSSSCCHSCLWELELKQCCFQPLSLWQFLTATMGNLSSVSDFPKSCRMTLSGQHLSEHRSLPDILTSQLLQDIRAWIKATARQVLSQVTRYPACLCSIRNINKYTSQCRSNCTMVANSEWLSGT
jgi:hypothetical protein